MSGDVERRDRRCRPSPGRLERREQPLPHTAAIERKRQTTGHPQEQPELVDAAQDVERLEHRPGHCVVLPPRHPREKLLGYPLPRAVTVEGRAAGEAALSQEMVHRAPVGGWYEETARHVRRLVEAEPPRP